MKFQEILEFYFFVFFVTDTSIGRVERIVHDESGVEAGSLGRGIGGTLKGSRARKATPESTSTSHALVLRFGSAGSPLPRAVRHTRVRDRKERTLYEAASGEAPFPRGREEDLGQGQRLGDRSHGGSREGGPGRSLGAAVARGGQRDLHRWRR